MLIREVVTSVQMDRQHRSNRPICEVTYSTGRKQSYQIVDKDGTRHGANLQTAGICGMFFSVMFLHAPLFSPGENH